MHDLLQDLRDAPDGDEARLEDLVERFDSRAYAPLLWIPGLVSISPIGMIPGMSLVSGAWILLVVAQMLVGADRPWLPRRLLCVRVGRERVEKTVEKLDPGARWLDRYLKPRLTPLVSKTGRWFMGLACVGLAASMAPLAVVPFGVLAPGLAVTVFATSLLVRDGGLALAAWILTLGSAALVWWTMSG